MVSIKSNTLSGLTAMLLAACFLCVAPNALAQDTTNIRLVVLDGDNQIGKNGQALPKKFAVRLTDNLGVPFAGATIAFANSSSCVTDAPLSVGWIGCFGGADLGNFGSWMLPPPGASNQGVFVSTDSNGVAVAPTYIAGSTVGQYSVWAFPPSLYPYYFSGIPSADNMVYFHFSQSAAAPIPTLSPLALMALAAALGLRGFQILRLRPKGSLFSPRK